MKKILLLLAFAICFYGYGQNLSKIEPDLQNEIQLRDDDNLMKINIVMKPQYDQLVLRSLVSTYRSKEEKRSFVINELKRYANETQQDVMSYLKDAAKNEAVTDIKQFWVFNGITCFASKEAIKTLSYREDIHIIGLDKEYYMLPEDEYPTVTDGTKEITYNVAKVNADKVWELGYEGEGVIVAVFDTGVNYQHHDLRTHMWSHPDYSQHGWNFVSNTSNPMDDHGHGTHCAGTVAGDGTAGSKTGMAPKAKIMALKIMNSNGTGIPSSLFSAVEFALERGAHVFSMSVGYRKPDASLRMMFRNAMVNVLQAGVIAAVAAGNDGGNSGYPVPQNIGGPGDCPPPWLHPDQTTTGGTSAVVCVGATNSSDNIADFSSTGPVSWQNVPIYTDYPYDPGMGLIRPDVCAPGVGIKSLNAQTTTGYANLDGTSMATPCVAGVMALMLSKNAQLMPAEICEILENTAVHLSAKKNNIFGSGRINALAAVNTVVADRFSYEITVNDSQGNNNGNANPGETITLDFSVLNKTSKKINNVSMSITTTSEYVTITNGYADFGDFAAGEFKKIEGAFTFKLSSSVPPKKQLQFLTEINTSDGEATGQFIIAACDYELRLTKTVINDSGNGILDPGETANITTTLNNSGNEMVKGVTGFLTSTSQDITINKNNATYTNMQPNQSSSAPYNVTLGNTFTPGSTYIPFNLLLTDETGRTSSINFAYCDRCNLIFDLYDGSDDGWTGNQLVVTFNDGSPAQNLTIPDNSNFARHSLTVNSGVAVSLSWITGTNVAECSFEIFYQDGDAIFSASGDPGSGVFFAWIANCNKHAIACNPISELSATVQGGIVNLSWNTPEGSAPKYYEIFKNVESLGTTTVTSFSTPATGTENKFCVYAVYDDCLVPECLSVKNTESIEEHSNLSKVYPNPSNTVVYVEGERIEKITIANIMGQIVKVIPVTNSTTAIDVSHFPIGNYLFHISYTNNTTETAKIIIQ
ncbi:MAG: S8 family serine peptidase [Lentimicrobiaceae bacterium]|nr:S8 family serine peptidase [Lentimicrobiaceae bacterium]